MNALDIVNRLTATSSRTEKEQIIFDAFMRGHREFFIAARLAYDPLITFGIKKVALIEEADDSDNTYEFSDFLTLADRLYHRDLTGHDARHAINAAASCCDMETWNGFYRRVLLKDFKAGIEEKTINKVLGKIGEDAQDYIIPIFACQLAQDGADPKNAKKLSGLKMLDVKLDGVRLLTVLDKESGTVTQYTRNGKLNENFVEITDALKTILDELPGSIVLDGEITSTSFQDLMTQINRRTDRDTSKARLALFDVIPLGHFREGICKVPQEDRHQILTELVPVLQTATNGLVYVVPKVTIDLDTPVGYEHFKQYNKEAVQAGYEGIMVKDPTAPYECKRTASWLKIKPWIEVSLAVVGFEEGKADSKYKGTLGALILEGEDEGVQIRVNCGSGLSDSQRDEIWQNQDKYLGMIGEIRADAKTLERGATVYSLRFPRWKGWRGTVPGEKL